jgi:hypothetical protein
LTNVFSPETTAFLESGCALIVAVVDAGLHPRANRGWGLDVIGDGVVRILLDADDETTLAYLAERDAIAITGTSVVTLRSVQLKGRALSIDPVDDDDRARAHRYRNAFFTDVVETDGFAREKLERMVPTDYVACTVAVDAAFDQTPGPQAGRAMAEA